MDVDKALENELIILKHIFRAKNCVKNPSKLKIFLIKAPQACDFFLNSSKLKTCF